MNIKELATRLRTTQTIAIHLLESSNYYLETLSEKQLFDLEKKVEPLKPNPILVKGIVQIETFKDENGDRSIEYKIKISGKLDYESETLEILRLINMLTS